ncbi:hypothetical protein M408DRAFT_330342 [Serendipita vermifera MAFF 305830]|uniref:RING-type domain-containing protein n=1 Tax=Serendipita vermifera MAFF 305830 TaxID=933852 RepID=A0A0C2XD01_SERVB|nr:hypothetical protein M408DRAFT_330342 [Serendipita vermifera MAFF 305830]
MYNDIFTKVSDKGATAALLYSNYSDGCFINSEYLNGDFDQLFDIFTTKTAASAKVILSQYQHVNLTSSTYDSGLLNNSYGAVRGALPRDAVNHSPYLVAILRGANATLEDPTSSDPVPTRAPVNNSNSNASQSLAMIILYVIVGVVSALFVIVILSGAIRAFRHPERYGPRLYHPGMDGEEGVPQTRAAGITRAILDTFPVVKFGRHNDNAAVPVPRSQQHELKAWDTEAANASNASSVFLQAPQGRRNAPSDESHATPTLVRSSVELEKKRSSQPSPTNNNNAGAAAAEVAGNTTPADIDPAAIGTETCPICIVDFEEGDDLRVLPCEGKHRFHKDCVDPWLLELSSSCPICREDFQALENMAVAAGTEEQQAAEAEDQFPQEDHHDPPTAATSRFSRYMHFAQRRRRSQRDSNTSSSRNAAPTHPPAPYTDY